MLTSIRQPPLTSSSWALCGENVPYNLRGTLECILDTDRIRVVQHVRTLRALHARLSAALASLPSPDAANAVQFKLRRAEFTRKALMAQQALHVLESGKHTEDLMRRLQGYITRYLELENKERDRRRQEAARASRAETRFLPTLPSVGAPVPGCGDTDAHAASGTHMDAVGSDDTAALQSMSSLAAMTSVITPRTHFVDFSTAMAQEASYTFAFNGIRRPVELLPFDMCPRCHVVMRNSPSTGQLVCPVSSCRHWKRFADMTSQALAFGDDVDFNKYSYRPVSHLDEIIRFAEARETFVVPPDYLECVMLELAKNWVLPEDLSIPKIRNIVQKTKQPPVGGGGGARQQQGSSGTKAKPKLASFNNFTVQIYCRLSGYEPRRMTDFMKNQMRIMFTAQEGPYRKHCAGRINNLSFPVSLYKYCELLGYYEMLQTLPLLRSSTNMQMQDAIRKMVCKDLDWEWIPTVLPDE